ncbi:MAG TPA: histidine kinase, partial [Bacteroidales bacterium]|nr:histidine kinase [Bacteroidales bacterium]
MKRLLDLALHPLHISLWGTALILLLLPVNPDKYRFRVLEKGTYISELFKQYDDLDGDGNSEEISFFINSFNTAGLTLSNPSGHLNQWNFRGRFDFTLKTGLVMTGDLDNNRINEVYIFTLSADSVLMHCIPDFRKPDSVIYNRLVTRVRVKNGKSDPYVFGGVTADLTGDGYGELIFGIGTGYSLKPRRVFAYDHRKDSFLLSPESGYFISNLMVENLAGDSVPEILLVGYAAGNIHDRRIPYTDSVSWLMVLDHTLRFLFPPIPFNGEFSNVRTFAVQNEQGRKVIGTLYFPNTNQPDLSVLSLYSDTGMLLKSRKLQGLPDQAFPITWKKKEYIVINMRNQGLELFDRDLNLVKKVAFSHFSLLEPIDIDLDGKKEILCIDLYSRQIHIIWNDLRHRVTQPFEGEGQNGFRFSLIRKIGNSLVLYLQFGNSYNLYEYNRNPLYPLRFIEYAGIYMLLLIMAYLPKKIRQDQMVKKQETEKKITDLQLRILRNQLDPHFIMNAVNSIMSSITFNEQENVKQQLMHFSRLHRSLLLQADNVMRTLEEEISFLTDYLALEKYRFGDRFEYEL